MTGEVAAGLDVTVKVRILNDTYVPDDTAAGITPQGLVGVLEFYDNSMRFYKVTGDPVGKVRVLDESSIWENVDVFGSGNGKFYVAGTFLYNCSLDYIEVNPYTSQVTSTVVDSVPGYGVSDCQWNAPFPIIRLIPGTNPTDPPRLIYAKELDCNLPEPPPVYEVKVYAPKSGTHNIGLLNLTSAQLPISEGTAAAGATSEGFLFSYAPLVVFPEKPFSNVTECNPTGSLCKSFTLPNTRLLSVVPVTDGYQMNYCDYVTCYVQASINGEWLPPQNLGVDGQLFGLPTGNSVLLSYTKGYMLFPNATVLAGQFAIPGGPSPDYLENSWGGATSTAKNEVSATFFTDAEQGVATITIDSSGNAKPAEITMPFKPPRTLEKVNPATIPTTLFNNTARVIAGAAASTSIAAINSTSTESASAQNPSAGNYQLPSNSLLFLMAACGSLIVFLSVYAAYRLTRSAANASVRSSSDPESVRPAP